MQATDTAWWWSLSVDQTGHVGDERPDFIPDGGAVEWFTALVHDFVAELDAKVCQIQQPVMLCGYRPREVQSAVFL